MRRPAVLVSCLTLGALLPLATGCFFNTDFCKENDCGNGGKGGNASTSSTGGAGGGLPVGCDLKEGQPIDPTCGVFVKAGATGKGTQTDPMGSVVNAVPVAQAGAPRIYICGGDTFTGSVSMPGGISILGGLDCSQWAFGAANPHPVIRGSVDVPAVTIVSGDANGFLSSIDIEAVSAMAPGASSVALFTSDASGNLLSLTNVTLKAGDGAPGMKGMDGGAQLASATMGNMGSVPCTNPPDGGPPAKPVQCMTSDVGIGGAGGPGGKMSFPDGNTGAAGDTGVGTPATGGVGEVGAMACQNGGNGNAGMNGPFGQGAQMSELGALSSTGYANQNGHDGTPGGLGHGGGGGGGAKLAGTCNGPGGGSGGPGGCGGLPGIGGQAGGSSLGLVSASAKVSMKGVRISLGSGATGGDGGGGQLGQPGGAGGLGGPAGSGTKKACAGGDGGDGGHGGSGGGGRGGNVFAVLYAGMMPTGTPVVMAKGTGGKGGAGGTNTLDQATPGADGAVADLQVVPAM